MQDQSHLSTGFFSGPKRGLMSERAYVLVIRCPWPPVCGPNSQLAGLLVAVDSFWSSWSVSVAGWHCSSRCLWRHGQPALCAVEERLPRGRASVDAAQGLALAQVSTHILLVICIETTHTRARARVFFRELINVIFVIENHCEKQSKLWKGPLFTTGEMEYTISNYATWNNKNFSKIQLNDSRIQTSNVIVSGEISQS